MTQLVEFALATPRLRRQLNRDVIDLDDIDRGRLRRLTDAALPGSPPEWPPTRLSLAAADPATLAQVLRISPENVLKLQLAALGFAPSG